MLILLHCARRYEPARGFQFSTYACKSIRLHLTGFLASYVRRGVIRVPESAPADVIAACQTRLLSAFENCHDRLPAPDATHDTEAVEEARHLVAAAIRRLPTRMRYLAKLRHVRGLTHTQIARRLERTKESVRQRFMRIDPLLARIIRDISTPSDG
jgi:RNA polymerase sigma factor (sigma-70 family)